MTMATAEIHRSPFRTLQLRKDTMESTSRLRDTPMEYVYDSPSRSRNAWLDQGESSKQGRENGENSKIHPPPISETISGPDISMTMETPPRERSEEVLMIENDKKIIANSRKNAFSGSIARNTRSKTARKVQNRKGKNNSLILRPDEDEAEDGDDDDDESREWQDEESEKSVKKSIGKRMGDTFNIQYNLNSSIEKSGKNQRNNLLDPEWLLGIVQVTFNSIILIGIIYILLNGILILQSDVKSKVKEYEFEYLSEIESCSQSYHLNKCGTEFAVPALASVCNQWQRCSSRDPGNVGKARVAAETLAEIVNGFVDVVSWKSMIFTILSLLVIVGGTNSFLSFFRLKSRRNFNSIQRSNRFKKRQIDTKRGISR